MPPEESQLEIEAHTLAAQLIPKLTYVGEATTEEFTNEVKEMLLITLGDATSTGNPEIVTLAVKEAIDGDATIDFDVLIGTLISKIGKNKLKIQAQANGTDGIMELMEELGIVDFKNAAGMMKWANFLRAIDVVVKNGPNCVKALEKLLREKANNSDSFFLVLSGFLINLKLSDEQNRPADYMEEPTIANLKDLAAKDEKLLPKNPPDVV